MDSLVKAVSPPEDTMEEKNISPEMETPDDNIPPLKKNPVPALPEELIPEKKEELPLE